MGLRRAQLKKFSDWDQVRRDTEGKIPAAVIPEGYVRLSDLTNTQSAAYAAVVAIFNAQ